MNNHGGVKNAVEGGSRKPNGLEEEFRISPKLPREENRTQPSRRFETETQEATGNRRFRRIGTGTRRAAGNRGSDGIGRNSGGAGQPETQENPETRLRQCRATGIAGDSVERAERQRATGVERQSKRI